jgi:hypothetical protein
VSKAADDDDEDDDSDAYNSDDPFADSHAVVTPLAESSEWI